MSVRGKRPGGFVPVGKVVEGLLKTCRPEAAGKLGQIWDIWDQAVGEAIGRVAIPVAFKGRLLLVNVTSSTWLHHLQFLKQDVIVKVNQVLGEPLVADIRFRIGQHR